MLGPADFQQLSARSAGSTSSIRTEAIKVKLLGCRVGFLESPLKIQRSHCNEQTHEGFKDATNYKDEGQRKSSCRRDRSNTEMRYFISSDRDGGYQPEFALRGCLSHF